jgi:molecular chaperone DnaK (HSP70)
VLFFDMGATATSMAVVSYVTGRLSVKATGYARDVGGDAVTQALTLHFAEEFKTKTGKDVRSKPKSWLKLLTAVEKAKKLLSPDGVKQSQINVEYLYEDTDFNAVLDTEAYDAIANPILQKLAQPLAQVLEAAGTTAEALMAVEVVGGGSRMKGIKVQPRTLTPVIQRYRHPSVRVRSACAQCVCAVRVRSACACACVRTCCEDR